MEGSHAEGRHCGCGRVGLVAGVYGSSYWQHKKAVDVKQWHAGR